MKRIVIAAIVASVLLPAAATGLAAPARADVVAVSLPAAVTISARTLSFSGTVRVGSSTAGLRSASLWFRYPNTPAPTRVGTATSRRAGFLAVTASLDARLITPGVNRVLVKDDADGGSRTIMLDLRRLSRVTITHAEFRSSTRVALAVRVTHFDPKLGRFAPSRLSPVRLQEKVGNRWVQVAKVTTDASGLAGALVPAGPGTHDYRALRPDGATVLAATSRTIRTGRSTGTMILP
jgi:hypothetical protein